LIHGHVTAFKIEGENEGIGIIEKGLVFFFGLLKRFVLDRFQGQRVVSLRRLADRTAMQEPKKTTRKRPACTAVIFLINGSTSKDIVDPVGEAVVFLNS
jgi:hypothetical protein